MIDSIEIVRRDVFDLTREHEHEWLARLANKFHSVSAEQIIRRELLFARGEPYDSLLAAESERNLRRTGLFQTVLIWPDSLAGDSVVVHVDTQDAFSLRWGASFGQEGGVRQWRAYYAESNLLGRAWSVRVEANHKTDRRRPLGGALILQDPRLFHTRWAGAVELKDSEDERVRNALLYRPFATESSRFAALLYAETGKLRRRVFDDDGDPILDTGQRQDTGLGWFALSHGQSWKTRWGFGYERSRRDALQREPEPSDQLDLVTFSLGSRHRRYERTRNLDRLDVVEDLPLGLDTYGTIGFNVSPESREAAEWYGHVGGRLALRAHENHYFGFEVLASSFMKDRALLDRTIRARWVQHHRLSHQHLVVASASCVLGDRWSESKQVTLGADHGLRGYPQNRFAGQRALLFNLEERTGTLVRWWIFSLAAVLFTDVGAVWDEGESIRDQRFHWTAGPGLRIGSAKNVGSGIVRIDLPYRFEDATFPELILTRDQLMRAYLTFEFITPEHR